MTRRLVLLCLMATLLLPSALWSADGDEKTATGIEVKIRDLKLNVPKTWKQQDPASRLRLAQFVLPSDNRATEPGELAVFRIGGAKVKDNIKRWVSQFQPEERKVKISIGNADQGKYLFVELTGTYMKPDGSPGLRKTIDAPGYRVIAVILAIEGKGNYFIRAVGPDKTIATNAKAIRQSFGGKAAEETEIKME